MSRPMAIYISGPISGIPYGNKPAFDAAEERLRRHYPRAHILNPHYNDLPVDSPWQEHMRADILMLMRATHVCMLPGWSNSRGAKIEYDLAHTLCMDVFTLDEFPAEACA